MMQLETKFHTIYISSILLALAFCVVVGVQNRALAQQVGPRAGYLAGPPQAIPGDLVPPFRALDAHGDPFAIEYSVADDETAPHRLLFIYSNACAVCTEQKEIWRRLLEDVPPGPNDLEVQALILPGEAVEGPVAPSLEALAFPDLATQRAYRATSIPLTLLITPDGRIRSADYGLLETERLQRLREALKSLG